MEEESEGFYRRLCSSETLRSGSKGFFRDFSESVINEAGESWITKIFGRASSDVERVKIVLSDPRVKDIVADTLSRVKQLYRDKDPAISRSKRLEGLAVAAKGDHEKALVLLSQAVLRAPATGKLLHVDQGFSLPLGLLARADTLMALRDYDFALQDLKLASEEDLPKTASSQLLSRIEECTRLLGESKKSLITYGEGSSMTDQSKKQFKSPIRPALSEGPCAKRELSGASKLVDIRETTSAGKHAVAARDILPGDVLASETPIASCLLPEFYGTHCQHCFLRLRAPVGCPVCSSVAFCSRECRDQAVATYHKYECKILALLVGSGMSVLSTLAMRMVTQEGKDRCRRICMKLRDEKLTASAASSIEIQGTSKDSENGKKAIVAEDRVEENLSKSAKRRLRKKKLKENSSGHCGPERNDKEPTKKSFESVDFRAYELVTIADRRSAKDFLERTLMALFLLKGLEKVRFFDKSPKSDETTNAEEIEIGALLLRNLQLLQFNAHEIYETRLAPNHRFRGNKAVYIGVAIYPSVARFNHDCYPAVTRYFAGRDIIVRALRPLKPGDVVAENYGPIFTKKSLEDRQRSLMGRYWFKCSCQACNEDWPGFDNLINHSARLRCPSEGCKGLLSQPRRQSTWIKCSSCGETKNLAERMEILAECEVEYTRGLALMEEEKSHEAAKVFAKALEKFHGIASPPHRETHLAEIAFAACLADTGNTWRPLL